MSERLFDEATYLHTNPDVAAAVQAGQTDAWTHFLAYGRFEGRSPSHVFDPAYYLARNPDVAEAVEAGLTTAYDHFIQYGQYEGLDFLPCLDLDFYLQANPDVASAVEKGETSAIGHFLAYGQHEDRPLSPFFDMGAYVALNKDVAEAAGQWGTNGLQHLLLHGHDESRPLGNGMHLDQFAHDPAFQQANTPFEKLARIAEVALGLPDFITPEGWEPEPFRAYLDEEGVIRFQHVWNREIKLIELEFIEENKDSVNVRLQFRSVGHDSHVETSLRWDNGFDDEEDQSPHDDHSLLQQLLPLAMQADETLVARPELLALLVVNGVWAYVNSEWEEEGLARVKLDPADGTLGRSAHLSFKNTTAWVMSKLRDGVETLALDLFNAEVSLPPHSAYNLLSTAKDTAAPPASRTLEIHTGGVNLLELGTDPLLADETAGLSYDLRHVKGNGPVCTVLTAVT